MGLERLLSGHTLCDRYRVEHVIGRGGMGAVYRATDLRLDRAVAVKVITAATADVAARARLRSRFHREARAAARLQHPNVVTTYDFGTDPRLDLDFLVMELLRGEDLAMRLQRAGRPELGAALGIVEQAARGVAAGHQVGLIHRDVKPGNVFLAESGTAGRIRVCVLDFGIVQLAVEDEEATATHLTVVGRAPHSPAYAAPEQLRGDPHLAAACDVWGLGATAFLLLTGERPFTDAEQRRMMDGMAVPAPSARSRDPRIPDAIDDVLRIALAHRPADRFRDAAAFAAAVSDARRGVVPARAAPTAAAARSSAAPPIAGDHTLLDAEAPRPSPLARAERLPDPFAAPARDGTLLDPALGGPHPAMHTATPEGTAAIPATRPPVPHAPVHAPKRRWLRRAASATWQAMITVASMVIAGALGFAMFESFYNNLTEPFYAAVAGLTLAIPWTVHRLLGRRGSYLLALLGCVGVAIAVFRFLSPLTGPGEALVALAPAQFLAAGWIVRLTRRPRPDDAVASGAEPSTSF
jgi:tRNA A-37 threonylcarbamoyl transferase component Bud32